MPVSSIPTWFRKKFFILFFLTLLSFAAFYNSLNNGFVADDIGAIYENVNIGKTAYIKSQPLVFPRAVIYNTIYNIWGKNPVPYRLFNIAIHIAVVISFFALNELFAGKLIAVISSALFAIHPLISEAVIWISGGPYAQYTLFLVLALLFFHLSQKCKSYLKFSYLFFLISLLSSQNAIVFPAIIGIYLLAFGNLKKEWPKLIGYSLIGATWLIMYVGNIGQRIETLQTDYYQDKMIANPLTQIPVAVSSYLELFVFPKNLTLYHSEMLFSKTNFYIRVAATIGYIAAIVLSYLKRKMIIFFALSFFIICLLPTLTPLGISWIVAERYAYPSSLGLFLLVGIFIVWLGKTLKQPNISLIICAICVAVLFSRTIAHNRDWKSADTLWLSMVTISPSSPQNHNNLGDYYQRKGDFKRAAEEFTRAIELKTNYGDAYHNLGNVYLQTQNYQTAIMNYNNALKFNQKLWQSHQNLAAIYFQLKQYALASENLERAVSLNPDNISLRVSLAVSYIQEKRHSEAKAILKKVLELNPQNQKITDLLNQIP